MIVNSIGHIDSSCGRGFIKNETTSRNETTSKMKLPPHSSSSLSQKNSLNKYEHIANPTYVIYDISSFKN